MKKGFTIIEVSILFVIFIIVAFLVAPLSLDDTMQAKNTSRWRTVQADFVNIFYSINTEENEESANFIQDFETIIKNEIKTSIQPYKITFLNGTYPNKTYHYKEYLITYSNAAIAYNLYKEPQDGIIGNLMYDVNGQTGPNVWGKDVFGYNIYDDRFEPFGKNEPLSEQKQDCSKSGTGLSCSNYYLIGGTFD